MPADLTQYIPASTLALLSAPEQLQACVDATQEADSYMRGRYSMPLLAWGSDVKRYTAWIAVFLIMAKVGLQPRDTANDAITRNYYAAVGWPDRPGSGWFPGVQRQAIHPDVTPSIIPGQDPGHDIPRVTTSQTRGWQQFSRGGKPVVS
jgi:phage gp36-like protein